MKQHCATRRINALIAAALSAFFLVHAALGTLSRLFLNADAPALIVWLFVFAGLAHIVLCLITSKLMLTDTQRPPSRKKVNHLWLKWASGAVLAAGALFHALGLDGNVDWFIVVVDALLIWHIYIGCKSLARDLDLPRGAKTPLRIIAMAIGGAIGIVATLTALGAL